MKKNYIYLFMLLLVFSSGYSFKQKEISREIYDTFFERINEVLIMKEAPHSQISINGSKEISMFKKEMQNIQIIKEYSSEPKYTQNFKNNHYKLMYVCVTNSDDKTKNNVFELLYSTTDRIMIAKKNNLFMKPSNKFDEKSFGKRLYVYEFKVPEDVNNILKKYESKLPKDGFFSYSWSGTVN